MQMPYGLCPNSLHVEMPCQLYKNAAQSHCGQLVASANEGREEDGIGRSPEHVTVNLLPAILVTNITLLYTGRKDH